VIESLFDLQREVSIWAARNFPDDNRETVVLGLAEEVGEMCRAALKRHQGIRGTAEEWDAELRKEIGDVAIKLAHVAEVWGFDLGAATRDRWEVVSKRDFVADPIGHGLPGSQP
jgi:NTP pyrophosphatase (non-canonical NTP hydrolase)